MSLREFIENLPPAAKIGRRVRNAFPDIETMISGAGGETFDERLYRFAFSINGYPQCLHCGIRTGFINIRSGYREFCSVKCASNSSHVADRKKTTALVKYGVEHYSKTKEYMDKYTTTMQERYGVNNAGQSATMRHRSKEQAFLKTVLGKTACTPLFSPEEYRGIRDENVSTIMYPFICENGHKFETRLYGRHGWTIKCKVCCPSFGGPSNSETEIADYLCDLGYSLQRNSRNIIAPKELDIYVPELKLAIEFCGNYWHSDAREARPTYHYDKMVACEKLGIQLITVFEDEWINKQKIVKERLAHITGKQETKIYARKCTISEVSASHTREFMNEHHIQGFSAAKYHIGLFHNTGLVAVMSFAKHRFSKTDKWELVRFATAGLVIGAAGKLLGSFAKTHRGQTCISYADRRYSKGRLYEVLGFTKMGHTKPNYWYIDPKNTLNRHNRLSFTKQKLVNAGFNPALTEETIMQERGFYRLWDCGSLIYEKVL